MNSTIRDAQMRFVVQKMLANAADVQEQRANGHNTPFYEGMATAYHEMLDTMKNQLIIDDKDLKDFGLNVDLEKLMA